MNYSKVYAQIIERARTEPRTKLPRLHPNYTYYEAHHIIPKCRGGLGLKSEWRTHSNIVLLTGREHFICHWLLSRMYPNHRGIVYAFWAMCFKGNSTQQRYCSPSRAYQEAKELRAKTSTTEDTKAKISSKLKGRTSPTKGKKRTVEQIQKGILTKRSNGNNFIKESTKLKMVSTRKVRGSYTFTESHKSKLRGVRGTQSKLTCPHCNKTGGASNIKRHHFNNCKQLIVN